MSVELPVIPAGVVVLLNFFAPYAVALINAPGWAPRYKRLVAVAVPAVLGLLVLVFYFVLTGDRVPDWPVLLLLAVVVCQASYTLLYKSASAVEARHGSK